jgi:hypothetical protein
MAGACAPAIFLCPPGGLRTLSLKSLNYRDSARLAKIYLYNPMLYLTSRDCRRGFAVKGDYFSFLAISALLFAPTHP